LENTRRDLGPLHALLTRGLPSFVDVTGTLRTPDLAKYLGISYQALYKSFERNRIAPKRAKAIILLSKQGPSPLCYDDFVEFM
jgi:hypothetical protein